MTITTASIPDDDLETLSEELRALAATLEADQVDPESADRLKQISQKIDDGVFGELVGIDLNATIDPAGIEDLATIAYQKRPRDLSMLEFARNVLVLVPLAFTWFELSRASANYSLLVNRDSSLITRPFLLLWEEGFHGIGGSFDITFSGVALLDTIVLAVVIGLTWRIHGQHDVKDAKAEMLAVSLRRRAEKVRWKLNEQLALLRAKQDQTQIALKIGKAVDLFDLSSTALVDILEWLRNILETLTQEQFRTLTAFTADLTGSTQLLVQYGDNVHTIYERLTPVVELLAQQVERLDLQQQQLLISLGAMDSNTRTLIVEIGGVGQSLKDAIDNLRHTTDRSSDSTQMVATAVGEIHAVAQMVVDGETGLRETLTDVRAGLQKTTDKAGGVVTVLDHVSDELHGINQSQQDMTTQVVMVFGGLTTQLAAVEKVNDETQKLVEQLRSQQDQSAREVKEATENLKQVVDLHRQETKQLATTLGKETRHLTDTLGKETQHLADALAKETHQLTEVVRRLSTSITRIQHGATPASAPSPVLWLIAAVVSILALGGAIFWLVQQGFLNGVF